MCSHSRGFYICPSPPTPQVGLGGPLNPHCKSWTDAIRTFGQLSLVPGSSDGLEEEAPACTAAAGTSMWEQARRAAGDRMRTRLCRLVAGASLQLRRVAADSCGEGVEDSSTPRGSTAVAV